MQRICFGLTVSQPFGETLLDVKDAVGIANRYIENLFGSEGVHNVGLEEVERDTNSGDWLVTIGFSRPWDKGSEFFSGINAMLRRTYKVVRIDSNDGAVLSVRNREAQG